MKVEILYVIPVTEIITVPKEWEFIFYKDEDEYTAAEWYLIKNYPRFYLPYEDMEVLREVE